MDKIKRYRPEEMESEDEKVDQNKNTADIRGLKNSLVQFMKNVIKFQITYTNFCNSKFDDVKENTR